MAEVIRYFDASGAGAADGTSFANRAAFVTAGVVSTVITGFAFNGSDSLKCMIVGGNTYTVTTSLVTATFANPPTAQNQLTFHGCDSSGNPLAIPDATWSSDEPAWTDTTLPVIATTTNILTANVSHLFLRLIKLTASGRNGAVITLQAGLDWCVVINSTANTAATTLTALFTNASNCVLSCTGSSYSSVVPPTNGDCLWNCRIVGNASASSGNCHGVAYAGTTMPLILDRCTVISNPGVGVIYTGVNAAISLRLNHCVIANNTSGGVQMPNTASQSMRTYIDRCMITGNGGYGVNAVGTNTNIVVKQSRLRDNSSGNFGNFGNHATDWDNYTTDSDDATEYVNSGAGNYQIKAGATIHGSGYGVSEQASAAVSSYSRSRVVNQAA